MREYPHSRSYEAIKILAQQRGFTVGCYYAEAFMLGRIVNLDQNYSINGDTGGIITN